MGFFSYIGNKMNEKAAEVNRSKLEAERYDARDICHMIERASSITQRTGYMQALRTKADEMRTNELKDTFDFAYTKSNMYALSALMPIMEREGLAHKDENGIHKDY